MMAPPGPWIFRTSGGPPPSRFRLALDPAELRQGSPPEAVAFPKESAIQTVGMESRNRSSFHREDHKDRKADSPGVKNRIRLFAVFEVFPVRSFPLSESQLKNKQPFVQNRSRTKFDPHVKVNHPLFADI
jgi:hypothetical protein